MDKACNVIVIGTRVYLRKNGLFQQLADLKLDNNY